MIKVIVISKMISFSHILKTVKDHRGDTMVEVMVSMAVLAMVVGAAYATSTRSFQAGLNSQFRDQGLAIAQQQIEILKNADISTPSTINSYHLAKFCINSATLAASSTSIGCPAGSNNDYTVLNSYDSQTKRFASNVSWTAANGHTQQVTVYYKPNDSYVACPSPGPCSLSLPPTPPVVTNPPPAGMVFTTSTPSIAYGGDAHFAWNGFNIEAPCSASGAWNGNKPVQATDFVVNNLTTSGNNVFTLFCPGFNGAPGVTKQVTVVVGAPPSPSLQTLSATVYGNGNVYFNSKINPNGFATTAWYQWANNPSFTGCQLTTSQFGEPGSSNWINDSHFASYYANGTPANYFNCNTYVYWYRVCAYNNMTPSNIVCGNAVQFDMGPPTITAFSTWSEGNIWTNQGVPRWLYWNSNASYCNLSGPSGNYNGRAPNDGVYITVYPGTYYITCYNASGVSAQRSFAFNYYHSYFTAYQHAGFDGAWPGWTWGAVGEGSYGIPGDTSSFSVYGRACVWDRSGHSASFYPGTRWVFYSWVQDYGLVNDNFGGATVGKDCAGN